jgi:hypothetical protein
VADVYLGDCVVLSQEEHTLNAAKVLARNCDSVYGKADKNLPSDAWRPHHDEYVVYDPCQVYPRFLATCHLEVKPDEELQRDEDLEVEKPTWDDELAFMDREQRKGTFDKCVIL